MLTYCFIYLFSSVCIYFVFSLMLAHEFATPNYHLRISNTASRIITSVTRWRGGWRGCPWLCNIDIVRTHFLTYRPFLAEKKYPAPPPPPISPPPAHLALIYSLGPSSRNKYIIKLDPVDNLQVPVFKESRIFFKIKKRQKSQDTKQQKVILHC